MTFAEFNEQTGFETKAGFQLTPLQVTDVEQFILWRKSLNRYEVGTGKTVISTVVSLMAEVPTTIVCMPPILLLSWERWLNKVSERVLRYQGGPKIRAEMTLLDKRWVLMSHAIFRIDFEKLMNVFQGVPVEIIIDEAQAIKSPKAKLYTCIGLMSKNRRLQMLTGTPTSKPLDCYTYIKLKTPDLYRSYEHFAHTHVAEKDFFGSITAYQNLDVLAENFAVKSILRTKEEVHGYNNTPLFPDTIYELNKDHLDLYNQLVEEQLLLLDDGSKIDATTAQRMYHALQQIVVNYDYFSGDATKRSASYDLIDSVIEQTDCDNQAKSKLIIWTIYKRTSRSVLNYLAKQGHKAVGAYSEVDSNKSFQAFMEDPNTRILVANPQSAGAGLNPQSVCWESLTIETSTVPMLSRQANGRLDRVGQLHKPSMRYAVANQTVQVTLLDKLLNADELVVRVERTKTSLRKELYGNSS
jgi:hypothetical protein